MTPVKSGPANRLDHILEEYYHEHAQICLDPNARNLRHTYVQPSEDGQSWRVDQVLVDPDGHNDWALVFALNLSSSREANRPVMQLTKLGPVAKV